MGSLAHIWKKRKYEKKKLYSMRMLQMIKKIIRKMKRKYRKPQRIF